MVIGKQSKNFLGKIIHTNNVSQQSHNVHTARLLYELAKLLAYTINISIDPHYSTEIIIMISVRTVSVEAWME